jgi:hypothetical protein
MEILGLSAIFVFIIASEAPRLVREKMWKELGVFFVLLLMGAGLSIAVVLNIPVPNPTNIMERIFDPFTTWLDRLLL